MSSEVSERGNTNDTLADCTVGPEPPVSQQSYNLLLNSNRALELFELPFIIIVRLRRTTLPPVERGFAAQNLLNKKSRARSFMGAGNT